MLKYIISTSLFCLSFLTFAQNDSIPQDSVKYKNKYGLRVGSDLGKLARTFLEDEYTGFEINADYRLTKNIYIAGEIGNEEKTTSTDFLNSTAKGSYFKVGIDYNLYENWLDMDNMIYTGFRVGASTFTQTINSYTIYDTNAEGIWGQTTVTQPIKFSDLSAIWGELIIGIKAETLNNLYVGVNIQLKGRVSEKEPDNFENLYIPGFDRTYDSGSFGIAFGYSLSYRIPLYKKAK
ncbi:MAG: hypothetical protein HRT67_14120 [Flavobacteriaceae bacterium]|nr:hypothetical protein [Flavobacteriaceae bacterium]